VFIFYLLIGVGLLLLLYTAARVIAYAPTGQVLRALRWGAAVIGVGVALWLVVSGRLGQALMLLAALAPLFARWKSIFTAVRNAAGPRPGQASSVETAWIRMSLDHDSGAMDGLVLQGPWAGRRLAELAPDALVELLAELRVNDTEGAQLVEAYLDRTQPGWRSGGADQEARAESRPTSTGAMTRDEAARILGVPPDASPDAVREAHRRLMMKMHPDVGGSDYLAAKINQAKDVLLGA
jgi:hypothetical protein